ncbi:MAG TPA: choline dehydrogenase [Anaerolineae bacterium]|nr:choline dehydrogenase [Anaerolineae bacterium]
MHDYIIIGAGTAGCVLAHRLTEDPNTTVLLLEAGGPDKRAEFHIPVAFSRLFKTEHDWHYMTTEQPHANDRQFYWPRGKVLGGSGSMNAMIYIRGHRHDYDTWAELGNEEWSYDEILPYFKRGQNQERGASFYHGVEGALNIADLRDPNPLSRAFIYAGLAHGLPANNDFNGETQDGVGFYQVMQKDGKRHGGAASYLHPILNRPNLTVQTYAQATCLRFENGRAVGIDYNHEGQPRSAFAQRELILCGGAINSPQLLMLSGIGPGQHLQNLGIPVVKDLPGVGQNLQDHPVISVSYACTKPISLTAAEKPLNRLHYHFLQRGVLSSNVAEAGGFFRSKPDLPAPDLQLHFIPAYYLHHGFIRPDGHGFTIAPTLIRPYSTGEITLQSTDPLTHPRINPNYFADSRDMDALVYGVKVARQIAQEPAFDPYRGPEYTPGAQTKWDEGLRAFIRTYVETLYHPIGTCKMGNDKLAVVNSHLQVHGVPGLRIVDASVMPTIPGGNTHAPTVMIAERAADMIRYGR